MSSQAIYMSLSILSLTGLVGAGMAVGSGVALMAMEEEVKVPAGGSSVAHSVKEGRSVRVAFARGFAASGN